MMLQLSEIRSVIEDLVAVDPTVGSNKGVQRLDSTLARALALGEPIGLSTLIPAALMVRRVRPSLIARRRPSFDGLRPSDERLLGVLERWAVREIIRGTLLASRLWFLTFPSWLILRNLMQERVQPLQSTESEREADDVVMAGLDLRGAGTGTPVLV